MKEETKMKIFQYGISSILILAGVWILMAKVTIEKPA